MQEARHSGNLVIVPGTVVETVLAELGKECRQVVEDVYIEAARGGLVNPDSLFLRPDPDRRERAIALPAYVPGAAPAMGVKWISSFPGNLALGLPRASALIALNDVRTGLATAVLEGSRISGHRTALSAAVGARALRGGDSRIGKLAVIGTGYISATTLAVMAGEGWTAGSLAVHDLDADRARAFAAEHTHGLAPSVSVAGTLREALDDADVVLFATTAVVPYVTDAGWFKPGAVVLHMSLRDLEPEAMADAAHVVDDVSHALREKTSLALAVERGTVRREDITAIGDHLRGAARPSPGRTVVYAPFGLGSLDIAIGALVLERAAGREGVVTVPDFAGLL